MGRRKGLSLKTRFEVFKRDQFTCGYCGQRPPNIILEVDHIVPVSNKGTNDFDNLITSCFDCNRGKSFHSIEIKKEPRVISLKEQELQYQEYQDFLLEIDKRLNKEVEILNNTFNSFFPEKVFNDRFKASVKRFLRELGLDKTKQALEKAASLMPTSSDTLNYFCGICWKEIRKK